MKEELINRKRVIIEVVNAQSQKLLSNAKELYAAAKAHANATIKQQEDVNAQEITIAQREQAVVDHELKLQERE
jgi:hypothetical protein